MRKESDIPVAQTVTVVEANDFPNVVSAVAITNADGSTPQRRCRGCGIMFTPELGSNPSSRQGMRCSYCNRDYDKNFLRDTLRSSCALQ